MGEIPPQLPYKVQGVIIVSTIQTIEIDCEPFTPRPDSYLPMILEGTGIEVRETVSRLFGNYTWDYSDVDPEVWRKALPVISKRIKELYDKGAIRYGSW